MKKVKRRICVSNVVLIAFSILFCFMLSFSLLFRSKASAESDLAQGINFISATTNLREVEPSFENDKFIDAYNNNTSISSYLQNQNGSYYSFQADSKPDYLFISNDIYWNNSPDKQDYSKESPTDFINIIDKYGTNQKSDGTRYKRIDLRNCTIIKIDSDEYIYDGTNFYYFNKPTDIDSNPSRYYCSANNEFSATATDYYYISYKFEDTSNRINLIDNKDNRYNISLPYGYNYKTFENYNLISSFNISNDLFTIVTNAFPTLGTNIYYIKDTSGNYYPISADQTDFYKLEGTEYKKEVSAPESLNNLLYIKIDSSNYLQIETYTEANLGNVYSINPNLYYNSALGYQQVTEKTIFKNVSGSETYSLIPDKSASTPVKVNPRNFKYIKISDICKTFIDKNIFSKVVDDKYYYELYYQERSGAVTPAYLKYSDAYKNVKSLKINNNQTSIYTFLDEKAFDVDENGKLKSEDYNLYYKVGTEYKNIFNKIYYDNLKGKKEQNQYIQLDNHQTKTALESGVSVHENIENYYIAFGDIYNPTISSIGTKAFITALSVSAKLNNKYYKNTSIVLNDVITQTGSSFSSGSDYHNNYWYQYIDLENVWAYQNNQTSKKLISNAEGLYTFTFNYTYLEKDANGNYKPQSNSFEYSVYLYNTNSYSEYPTLNTNILYEGNTEFDLANASKNYLSYYYNYSTSDYPTYTFNPANYSVEYSHDYNGVKTTYKTGFQTTSRLTPNTTVLGTTYVNRVSETSYITIKDITNNLNFSKIKVEANIYESSSPKKSALKEYMYVFKFYTKKNPNSTTLSDYTFSHKTTDICYVYNTTGTSTETEIYAFESYKTLESKYENDIENMGDFTSGKYIKIEKSLNTQENVITKTTRSTVYSLINNDTNEDYSSPLTADSYTRISSTTAKLKITFNENTKKYISETLNLKSTTYLLNGEPKRETLDESKIINNFPKVDDYKNSKLICGYKYELEFKDLGVYHFENRYLISTQSVNDEYVILENAPTQNFNSTFLNREIENVNQNGYNLEIFGIRSYFNKNGETELKYDVDKIYSNQTFALGSSIIIASNSNNSLSNHNDVVNGLFENGKTKFSLPITNMPPITFKTNCNYAYTGIVSKSMLYKFDLNSVSLGSDSKVTLNSELLTEGKVNLSKASEFYFSKNSYPSADGLYIIVAEYSNINYAEDKQSTHFSSEKGKFYREGTKSNNKFYQVFAFVIDNSSPSVNIEKETFKAKSSNELTGSYVSLNTNSFTNQNVRLTYDYPTYFQYDKNIQLQKTNYSGITSKYGSSATNGFVSYPASTEKNEKLIFSYIDDEGNTKTFELKDSKSDSLYQTVYSNNLVKTPLFELFDSSNNQIDLNEKTQFYISDINLLSNSEKKDLAEKINYCKIIKESYQMTVFAKGSDNSGSYWGSGNYSIKISYGSSNNSYVVYNFTIDTLPISNTKLNKVIKNEDGSYSISKNTTFANQNTSNLINEMFTLTYSAKESGSPITTKYRKITFDFNSALGSKIIEGSGFEGISSNNFINTDSSTANIEYDYLYNPEFDLEGKVYANNAFNPSSSTIYEFTITDSAGNSEYFVVIFDATTPEYNLTFTNPDKPYYNTGSIKIIDDSTEVYWGNYKAIKLEAESIDEKYVFNNGINHKATLNDKLLKDIYLNPNKFWGTNLKRFWEVKKGTSSAIKEVELNEDGSLKHTTDFKDSNGWEITTANIGEKQKPVISYYLLVPLGDVSFRVESTSNTTNTQYKIYNPISSGIRSVLLDVSATALAENYVEKYYPTLSSSSDDYKAIISKIKSEVLANPVNNNYGFIGENKYIFNITDILRNTAGDSLWMNFDKTLAYVEGTFEEKSIILTKNTSGSFVNQSNRDNSLLKALTPESTYSAGQLYLSFETNETIPAYTLDYKFYDFDLDFFNTYNLTDYKSLDESNESYVFEFEDSTNNKVYKYTEENNNKHIVNADNTSLIRQEPVSNYPFSIAPSGNYITNIDLNANKNILINNLKSQNNKWNLIYSSKATNNSINDYTQINTTNSVRRYSNILNYQMENNYINSKQGLYVFRRIYTDCVDSSTGIVKSEEVTGISLGNDYAIRYYVYYIDRNRIIDLSSAIGNEIAMILGYGVNENNYKETFDYSSIESIRSNLVDSSSSSTNPTFSQLTMNSDSNLIETNKMLFKLNYVHDKYNVCNEYNKQIVNNPLGSNYLSELNTKLKNETDITKQAEIQNEISIFKNIAKSYVFNTGTDKFNLNFSLSRETGATGNQYNFVGIRNQMNNIINPNNNSSNKNLGLVSFNELNGTASTSSDNSGFKSLYQNSTDYTNTNNNPISIILRNPMKYNLVITDNAGISDADINKNNAQANSYQVYYEIKTKHPEGSYWGKNSTSNYKSNEDSSSNNYKTNLFEEFSKLLDISTATPDDKSDKLYGYSNNNSLFFYYKQTTSKFDAEIEPYKVVVTKIDEVNYKSSVIFEVNRTSDGKFEIPSKYNSNAFIQNKEENPNEWIIVVFDNNTATKEFKNILADPKENAEYRITIRYRGDSSLYLDSKSENSSYNSTNILIIDKVKPLYNLIRLMENDKTYSHSNLTNLPSGYNFDIKNYYYSLLKSGMSEIQIQYRFKQIYDSFTSNIYGEFLNTKEDSTITLAKEPYFFALDDITKIENIFTYVYNKKGELEPSGQPNNLDGYSYFFFRKIEDPSNYYYSLTSDDFTSNNGLNNPFFTESKAAETPETPGGIINNTYYKFNFSDLGNNKKELFESDKYYEIIERDAAGNYMVYAIYLTSEKTYTLDYSSATLTNETAKAGLIDDEFKNSIAVNGKDLKISSIGEDKYLKAYITYTFTNNEGDGSEKVYSNTSSPIILTHTPTSGLIKINLNGCNLIEYTSLELSPEDASENFYNLISTNLTDGIPHNGILDKIIQKYGSTANDFIFKITLVDRIGGLIDIEYKYPGKLLNVIFEELSDRLKVTIPEDKTTIATYIKNFEIMVYKDGKLSDEIMSLGDMLKNPVIPNNKGKSLGGATYYLGSGSYVITTIDNFDRKNVQNYAFNVGKVIQNVNFTGATVYKDLVKHTAKPVEITVDKSFYKVYISYEYNQENNQITYQNINLDVLNPLEPNTIKNDLGLDLFTISYLPVGETGARYTITPIDNRVTNILVQFQLLKDTSTPTISGIITNETLLENNTDYEIFTLFTKIPDLKVTNLSNRRLQVVNNQSFIEDINLSIDGNITEDNNSNYFNPVLVIKFKAKDSNTTDTLSAVSYTTSTPGTYEVCVTNDLGYVNNVFTFTREAENISLYSVFAVNKTSGITTKLSPSTIYTTTQKVDSATYLVYHYYALSNYSYYTKTTVDGKTSFSPDESTSSGYIKVISNTNNNITTVIDSATSDAGTIADGKFNARSVTYKVVVGNADSTKIVNYFKIHFVSPSSNFTSFKIDGFDINANKINSSKSEITLSLKNSYNSNNTTDAEYSGNSIYFEYFYNGESIESVNPNSITTPATLKLSDTGVYRIYVKDLAGNTLSFSGKDYIDIYLVNQVVYTINENDPNEPKIPIKNYITNKSVVLKLYDTLNGEKLYTLNADSIEIYRNGTQLTDVTQSAPNTYTFTTAGSYKVVVKVVVGSEPITTEIQFTIVNANYAIPSFNISSTKNFEVVRVRKYPLISDDTRYTEIVALRGKTSLWLSTISDDVKSEHETGNGLYSVTLRWYHLGSKQFYEFTFKVRINDETPTLTANIDFGTSSKKPIVISYNPGKIYEQVGEAFLVINGNTIATIDSNSVNELTTHTITVTGTYWISITDPEGNVLSSYKVIKKTPLNTTAKILIVVAVVVAVGLTVVFIIIRRKIRFK